MSGALSCSPNCLAVEAVTSILYWLSCTMKSIWLPLMPPFALISFTASLAPFAAGRSSADSSPVRAKPPPILIVAPVPPLAAPPPPAPLAGAPDGAAELQAATSPMTAATASPRAARVRIAPPPRSVVVTRVSEPAQRNPRAVARTGAQGTVAVAGTGGDRRPPCPGSMRAEAQRFGYSPQPCRYSNGTRQVLLGSGEGLGHSG